jgi:hypothetical protein
MSNIDRPNEAMFAAEIVKNIPTSKDAEKLVTGLGAAWILGKAVGHVSK